MPVIEDVDAAQQLIEMQLKDIENIRSKAPYGLEYTFWEDFTAKIIDRIFGNESNQRNGFEQAGRGGCFSVFESYSERQRREDFLEILNCKEDYLKKLIKDLEHYRQGSANGAPQEDIDPGISLKHDMKLEDVINSDASSPLDRAIAEILLKIKNPEARHLAEANLVELRDELLKPTPSWAKLKKSMIWLINFGKEEFFTILPYIVLYIRRIVD